jgi:predicted O-linked N-acetylglucosamine transferase (SPINDLY family)
MHIHIHTHTHTYTYTQTNTHTQKHIPQVDLNGYLSNTRLIIAALQPAPICVHHFAQPSTMGAHYIQNFMADTVIVPPEHAPVYSEAINYIPDIFISTSARLFSPEAASFPPDSPYSRSGLDLPLTGETLLCSFNALYKVQPVQFEVWARVMQQRPHVSLVLRAKNGAGSECMLDEVRKFGLEEERVHFSGDLAKEAHIKRCAACDIVVDTDNFNGITTTATVLWAGSPVVTHATENNAGRCAAAMLISMRTAELVRSACVYVCVLFCCDVWATFNKYL